MSSRNILGVSFLFLLGGFGLSLLLKWEGAPMAIALPVKIYSLTFENTRNGLFEGFFYIALGMYFGMNSESLIEIDVSAILAAIAIGVLGCFLISSDQHLLFCALVAGGIVLLSIRGGGFRTNFRSLLECGKQVLSFTSPICCSWLYMSLVFAEASNLM